MAERAEEGKKQLKLEIEQLKEQLRELKRD